MSKGARVQPGGVSWLGSGLPWLRVSPFKRRLVLASAVLLGVLAWFGNGAGQLLWPVAIAVLFGFVVIFLPLPAGRKPTPSPAPTAVPRPRTFRRVLDYDSNGLAIRTSADRAVTRKPGQNTTASVAREVGAAAKMIRTTGMAAVLQDGNGCRCFQVEEAAAADLRRGDVVLLVEQQAVPADGAVVEGFALIDESALTGESSPVVRTTDRERNRVLRGARVVSGRILVRIAGSVGHSEPFPPSRSRAIVG